MLLRRAFPPSAPRSGICTGKPASRIGRFHKIQADLGATSPRSDSTYDVRNRVDQLTEAFTALDITPPADFWTEVSLLQETIHVPGQFHTLIHGDAGPQNFIWDGEVAAIIDFEFVAQGHGLLDLVSARLGFPHSEEGHTLPERQVASVEESYRSAVGATIPMVEDNHFFGEALTDACAHWALVRWAGLWSRLFGEGATAATDKQLRLARSQAFTVYRRFVTCAETNGHRMTIARTFDKLALTLEKRFEGLAEMPTFPAFASPQNRD